MERVALEKLTNELFVHFSQKDFGAIRAMMADDCQGVDEISRRWMRGAGEIAEYFDQVGDSITDITTTLRDVAAVDKGDVGIVTCMLDQSYRYDGQQVSVVAPTTVLFVREDTDWKVALVHTVPLPEGT